MIHSLLVPNVFTTSFPTSPISSIGNAMNQHSLLLTEINNNEISGNMQHLLNSHFLLYSLRQNLYSMVLNQSHIYKEIAFEDQGESFHFTEKVQALTLQDFQTMMEEAGIYLLDIFGDYKLKKFHKTESERLIMIFK